MAQDLSPPNQYAVTHAEGAASQVANVQTGDTVTLTGYGAGTSNGAVYEYTGPTTSLDLNSQNYTASSNWELVSYTIQSGDTVTLTGYGAGTSPGDVYEYTGLTTPVDLNNQTYTPQNGWYQVGTVTVTAQESADIHASGSSAAVAISGGGIAVALAGAGVGVTNTILDTTES